MKKSFLENKSVKFRILVVPLIISFITFAAITSIVVSVTKTKLTEQMKTDGIMISNEVILQINSSDQAVGLLNEQVESSIRSIGKFLNNNASSINDGFLANIARTFDVDEINVTDNSGKIINSNLPSSLGQSFGEDHISYSVLKGEKSELMENIRKSRETDDYYKYGYVRKNDGGFVQIGILANKIQKFSTSLGYQAIVDKLVEDKNIVYALFMDKNLKAAAHSNHERIGISLEDIGSKSAINEGKIYTSKYYYEAGKEEVYDIIVPIKSGEEIIGAIDLGLSLKNIKAAVNKIILISTIIALISFAVFAAVLYIISRRVTKPLEKLVDSADRISKGDLSCEIEAESDDEIGQLSLSFKHMVGNLREIVGSIKEKSNETGEMSSNLSAIAEQLSCATNEVASAIQDIAQGATTQAHDLMGVNNNMAELSKELDGIYNKIQFVKENIGDAEKKANTGQKHIDMLSNSINDINDAFNSVAGKVDNLAGTVSRIGNITDVINNISDQTNLLALNAAIEAARAGESGRGFAVVADEVRKLAQESRVSTEEIKNLVQSITLETEDVIDTSKNVGALIDKQFESVEETIGSFKDILSAVSNVTPLIADTHTSINATLNAKDIVMERIENVSSVAQEMSASSEEISASSEEMLASANEVSRYSTQLNDVAGDLNSKINQFNL